MVLIGFAEYGVQWWRHERSLMMTDDELREEMKSSTGDPRLAAKRKKVRQEMLR
jgi:flagellar biosynthetic protein FlhB